MIMNEFIDFITNLFKENNVKLRDFMEIIHLKKVLKLKLKKSDLGVLAQFTDLKHDEYDCKIYL